MKIIELRAENVKRISAVAIRPNGNLVEITGKNGQGKTSVLDAIWWALEGTKNIQSAPIRAGADEAVIELDLGDLRVKRTFRAKEGGEFTTNLVVSNADGMRAQGPQSMLDALMGTLTFDPLAFTRMDAKKQFDTLKQFVPGFDFDAADQANKSDFAKRADLNRSVKDKRAQAAGMAAPAGAPAERIDESALVERLDAAGQHNTDVQGRKVRRESLARRISDIEERATEYETQAARLRREAEQADESAKANRAAAAEMQAKLGAAGDLPDLIDTAALRAEIATARQHNELFDRVARGVAERAALSAAADELEAQAKALTKAIDAREAAKVAAIADADMPVAGITFGDGVVLLGGVPFEQGSDAEQLRASVAIAAAMNPKLRVIRVRDGSLLDNDSMTLLAEIADERDMQVWVETVQSGRAGALVIEDGHLADAPALQAAE
jgi:DNA repair exonuclease SbcCD ATPase subunit